LRKHQDSVEGRVLRAIERPYWLNPENRTFGFALTEDEGDVLEALMPDGKFTGYLFNRDHKDGGPKAAFLIDFFGIEPDDWRYLAA